MKCEYSGMPKASWARRTSPPPAPDTNAIPAPYFLVSGTVTRGGSLSLDPVWTDLRPQGSSDHVGSGEYRLRLLNSSDGVLFERRFNPTWLSNLEDYGDFLEVVPAKQGTVAVRLSGPGISKVVTIKAGTSVPQVQVMTPNGGESWPARGNETITWKAGDANLGDTLVYTVFYSHDNILTYTSKGSVHSCPAFHFSCFTEFKSSSHFLVKSLKVMS